MLARLALVALLLTSGCASQIAAWKGRPAAKHRIESGHFWTLGGQYRLAFQTTRPDKPNQVIWCAESLPDVAQAVSATSEATTQLSKNSSAGLKDAFATTFTQTFARTEIAEVYRQMGWQACQAWAQGVLNDDDYKGIVTAIIDSGVRVIETRATQPLVANAKTAEDKKEPAQPEDIAALAKAAKAAKDKLDAACKKTPKPTECA